MSAKAGKLVCTQPGGGVTQSQPHFKLHFLIPIPRSLYSRCSRLPFSLAPTYLSIMCAPPTVLDCWGWMGTQTLSWPQTHYTAKSGPELLILLASTSQIPELQVWCHVSSDCSVILTSGRWILEGRGRIYLSTVKTPHCYMNILKHHAGAECWSSLQEQPSSPLL